MLTMPEAALQKNNWVKKYNMCKTLSNFKTNFAFIVYLNMVEFSYRFKMIYEDSCNIKVLI